MDKTHQESVAFGPVFYQRLPVGIEKNEIILVVREDCAGTYAQYAFGPAGHAGFIDLGFRQLFEIVAVQSEFELRRHRLCRKIVVERLPGFQAVGVRAQR